MVVWLTCVILTDMVLTTLYLYVQTYGHICPSLSKDCKFLCFMQLHIVSSLLEVSVASGFPLLPLLFPTLVALMSLIRDK